jgi:hypothetical protein
VLSGLEAHPSQILHLDEFGKHLSAIGNDKAPPYLRAMSKLFTEMFTTAGDTYHGGHYAGTEKAPVIIESPNLCLFGTSTLETYRDGITRDGIDNGELNRYLVYKAPTDMPPASRSVGRKTPPAELVKGWKAISKIFNSENSALQKIGGSSIVPPVPINVRWDGVLGRLYDIQDKADVIRNTASAFGNSGIWTRYREQVIKLAMILAIARNPVVPEIENADLDFAEAMVMHSCKYMEQFAEGEIADNDAERDRNKYKNFLREAGDWVRLSELTKNLKVGGGRGKIALKDLLEEEVIEMEVRDVETKKRAKYYRYVTHDAA